MAPERIGISERTLLIIDAIVNFILGVALVSYSPKLAQLLGIPVVSSNFYPNILGAVFLGITLALLLEAFRKPNHGQAGLGLTGALCINLCGGMALILWLAFGRLQLPVQGDIALWGLSVVLIVISTLELIQKLRMKPDD